jgi:hypothetical protein
MGGTGKATADHLLDFIGRGQRAQAAVDTILADQQKRMIDPEFEKNLETIRRGINLRIAQLKQQLFRWIDQNASADDDVPLTNALLEIAIERHLDLLGSESETMDFVTKTLQHVVHKPTGRLQ